MIENHIFIVYRNNIHVDVDEIQKHKMIDF